MLNANKTLEVLKAGYNQFGTNGTLEIIKALENNDALYNLCVENTVESGKEIIASDLADRVTQQRKNFCTVIVEYPPKIRNPYKVCSDCF